MVNFVTRYGLKNVKNFRSNKPSMTQQQFKNECDINHIIKRYNKDPQLWATLINNAKDINSPSFADFTDVGDFRHAMDKVSQIGEFFASIPSEVRARYNQNPELLFAAMHDPSQWQYLAEKGVLNKKSVAENLKALQPSQPKPVASTPQPELPKD